MATFFSGETVDYWSRTDNYVYGTLTGDVSRSGNTVTLSNLSLALTSRLTSTGTSSWEFQINGETVFNGTINHPPTNVSLDDVSFAVAAGDTSKSVSWRGPDGSYEGSFTVNFPAGGTGPSGGFLTDIIPKADSVVLSGGVRSGGSAATTIELIVLSAAYTQAGIPQRFERFPQGELSGTRTISNSSTAAYGGITIRPNSRYYLGVYASNSVSDYRYDGGTVVTTPEAPTVSLVGVENGVVTFAYEATADGGFYDKIIEYSTDGGSTWATAVVITSGSAASGQFTTPALTPGEYTLLTRARTASGSSESTATEFTVDGLGGLLSSEGKATEISGGLVSVGGVAKKITGILISKDGLATEG